MGIIINKSQRDLKLGTHHDLCNHVGMPNMGNTWESEDQPERRLGGILIDNNDHQRDTLGESLTCNVISCISLQGAANPQINSKPKPLAPSDPSTPCSTHKSSKGRNVQNKSDEQI